MADADEQGRLAGRQDQDNEVGRRVNNEIRDVLKAQRRRRRRNFWAGFAALAVLGGLWAQLSKDPFGPNFGQRFDNGFVVEDAPAIEVFEPDFAEPPVPTTLEVPATTVPQPTTIPTTTLPPTTVAP